jgi:RHS repeat-associated protein
VGDDRRITSTFTPTGWTRTRQIEQADSTGAYKPKQVTTWDYFGNGKLRSLETRNGAGEVKESHLVSYLDAANQYVNGNRTKDVFTLDGPKTSAPCHTAACTTTMTYDARDRLREERRDRGTTTKTTSYELDATGNVLSEDHGDWKRSATYDGDQVQTQTFSGSKSGSFKFFYDGNANLDCQTTSTGSRSDCNAPSGTSPNHSLVADYAYDSGDRLMRFRAFNGLDDKPRDSASYSYDAFDRPTEEIEDHPGYAQPRATLFKYIGLTDDVAEEEQRNGSPEGSLNETKSYSYDAFGKRIGLNDRRPDGSSKDFTYGTDVHGSISLLLDDAGKATASYGYTAYGDRDDELTEERDPWDSGGARTLTPDNPLNPYRFSDKRLDPGSSTLDMGARRFAPGTSFLQADLYDDALNDLDLSLDPLTQNRYALAGGNPISFVEVDGHMLAMDGGGGGSSSPKPKRKPTRRGGTVNGGRAQTAPMSDAASGGGYQHAANEDELVYQGRQAVRAHQARVAADARKKAQEDSDDGGGLGGFVHGALDAAGFAPGVGAVADVANAGLYAAEGKKSEAAFSLAAAVPVAGDIAAGGKLAYKGAKAVSKGDKVYRGLAKGEDVSRGISARNPQAGNDVVSHVAGRRDSQWISTTRDPEVARTKYGEHGVAEIDLNQVGSHVEDLSGGIPGMGGGMLSNWARADKEVLIQGHVPPGAARRLP